MSNNVEVLLVGTGNMGVEYTKVLLGLGKTPIAICRSEKGAKAYTEKTGVTAFSGGVEKYYGEKQRFPQHAIVAVNIDQLFDVAEYLVLHGVKSILLEKPGGVNKEQLENLSEMAKEKGATIQIAYNRRYYASTEKALEIIENDGGVTSFYFEFTEWMHVHLGLHPDGDTLDKLFLNNGTHVADLAFYLGGFPKEIKAFRSNGDTIHPAGKIFAGAGITEKGALFNYQANWDAPGRWGLEVMTNTHRLIFRPMEKLSIQELRSVAVNPVEIDDQLDTKYKPGLYREVEAFLCDADDGKRIMIAEQCRHIDVYAEICGEDIL